ncbi:hypothetical protein JAAARDRAFT_41148 [Jaapia argillacea MUCL 33604]|uniref:F-box domain-containing protein n=1 Tax=Jaapia argillacea MUCL 33604 TaxID=933084 RepID=A0A067P8S0_9AGAM|nr:hypothetical protein JAAARDRAFT_41148 [Jaapia argillacea MUCL 33604]
MELVVGDVELLQLFSLVDGAGLQMLQRFDLDIIQASGTAATRRILNGLNFLFHAPRLHDVQISSNMQDMAIPDLPWSQLTRLDLRLSPLSTSHILDILSKSPNLTDFSTIITAYLNPLETVTIQPLVHANLKYLNLVISTNFRHLFSRLTLPSLERLRVHCRTHISRGESDWGNLSSFLRRSAPPLDQLNLLLYWIPESDLLDCLTYVPSLTRFHCTADVQIDHILKAMTISSKSKTDSHPVVLPRLDTLILRGPTFAPQSLTDMVLSRYGDTFSSPSSLRQVRLDVADEIEELEISTRLAPLRELGLGLFLWP